MITVWFSGSAWAAVISSGVELKKIATTAS
jgi:hypothetical protein